MLNIYFLQLTAIFKNKYIYKITVFMQTIHNIEITQIKPFYTLLCVQLFPCLSSLIFFSREIISTYSKTISDLSDNTDNGLVYIPL